MSTPTSEQAITALEHSSKPTLDLLNDAADIVGFDLSNNILEVNEGTSSISKTDNAKFREQWIFRWMIKKLNQAVNVKQTSDEQRLQLLSDERLWRLLSYLLRSIPSHTSKSIILERDFCRILSDCLATHTSTVSVNELPSTSPLDPEADRPSKKRKISHDRSATEHRQASPKLKLMVNLLRIAHQIAEALLVVDGADASHRRSVPPNWTNGPDDAATFIARLITAATFVSIESSKQMRLEESISANLTSSLEPWIELWQANVTSAQNQRKQNSSLAFANHTLVPALDFLAAAANNSTRPISRALERQIATSCILPMRAVFRKQFVTSWDSASIWGLGETEPQWAKIQKVTETLASHLGESVAGFGSVYGEQRMATLLSIASRITPASDVIRRRADRPWIEALFLSLCCLRGTSKSKIGTLYGELTTPSDVSTAESRIVLPVYTSSTSLGALQATGIEPSANFWHFYVRFVVSGDEAHIPIATLAKMVRLNTSVFVPENDNITPSLLNAFCAALDKNKISNEQSLRLILDDILAPIWEEFGKRRRLNLLIEFWESRLLDTFHLRSTSTDEHPSNLLWDHPDLLDIFSSVCQHHASPSLCTNMLNIVSGDIARLTDIVGPTHGIFAKVTILGSMLKFMGRSPPVQQFITDQDESVRDSVCGAILRKTDYQGHRWRLWKILESFVQLFPTTLKTTSLPKLELPWDNPLFAKAKGFDSRASQSKPQLMELFQSFSCVTSVYENEEADILPKFTGMIANLNEMMQLYREHVKRNDLALEPWNGLSETMDSASKLLSGCLARLSRSSRTWYSSRVVPDDLLRNLATLSFGQSDTEIFTDLAIAAEATLSKTTIISKTSLLDVYSNAVSEEVTVQALPPPLLHSVAQGAASEQQIGQFFEVLFKTSEHIHSASHHESLLQYLSLATEAIANHPSSATSRLDFASYIQFLRASTSGATTEQLAAAHQFIHNSTQRLFMQVAVTWSDSEKHSIREELLKWTKKQLKEIAVSDEAELLNKYTGYLLLAVAQVAHEVDTTKASKKERKAIDEIREDHATAVIRQCRIIVGRPPDTIDFWPILVMLDSLTNPQGVESDDKKLEKCLQKVVSAIVVATRANTDGTKSTQHTRIIAKLWDILSKYQQPHKTGRAPDFPHASFAQGNNGEKTESALILQAQLATKYPRNDPVVSLARALGLSKVEGQSEISEPVSIAGSTSSLSIAASIRSLKLDHTIIDDETIEVLGHIACLQTALDETLPASLIIRLELSKIVLDKHPSIISQHVIDSTLMSITTLASSASKVITTADSTDIKPEYIFDRLCIILSTLLIRYRRRLTGRHHLLLSTLQTLLKCLFYPGARKSTPTTTASKLHFLSSLPPWLNPSTHSIVSNTLPALSATKFSRLLQTLCDPSASSARHVSKRSNNDTNNLTDDVKSLRREVSRHMQYLLQSYCQVTLDGYIAPNVKEKLLPGLYAAMNAMDVEVMRGLNGAMDGSQRAIWKDLYAEWRRFGRWNQR